MTARIRTNSVPSFISFKNFLNQKVTVSSAKVNYLPNSGPSIFRERDPTVAHVKTTLSSDISITLNREYSPSQAHTA